VNCATDWTIQDSNLRRSKEFSSFSKVRTGYVSNVPSWQQVEMSEEWS